MTATTDSRLCVNSSLYDISPRVTLANVRKLLEVKWMHLTALLVMTCGVVGGHVQYTERRGARQFPVVLPCDRRSVPLLANLAGWLSDGPWLFPPPQQPTNPAEHGGLPWWRRFGLTSIACQSPSRIQKTRSPTLWAGPSVCVLGGDGWN